MRVAEATRRGVLLLALGMLVMGGCKKRGPDAATEPASGKPPIGNFIPAVGRHEVSTDLGQISKWYMIEATTGTVPRGLQDLSDFKRDLPRVYKAIEEGRYVVCWGADPNRAPAGTTNTVLAYDKDVPEKGGVVAFLDGSIRNVTAQDFAGFDKPGAKKK
jgi:hypothetical protein